MTDEEVVRSCLQVRQDFINLKDDYVTIAAVDHGDRLDQSKQLKGETIADAATHMVLVIYRNQMVHAFVPYSLFSMIVIKSSISQQKLCRGENNYSLVYFGVMLSFFCSKWLLQCRLALSVVCQ